MRRADLLLAAGVFALGAVEVLAVPLADDVVRGPTLLNLLAVAAYGLPLAVRSRHPVLAFCVVHAALGARALLSDPLELYVPVFAGLVGAWSIGTQARVRDAVPSAAVAAVALAVAQARGTGGDATPDTVASLVLLGVVWAIAVVTGRRASTSSQALRQAEELDAQRAEREAAAVLAERRRIAHELHDAVSHSLSMITMQAGGAQEVLGTDPERALTSLRAIEDASRRGLAEMRQLLGLLDAPEGEAPGLASLDELVDSACAAGLTVAVTQEGEPRPLRPGVDIAAYRVLQEALTNAARHAGRCSVEVLVRWSRDELQLEVVNDVRAHLPSPGAGRGLPGMAVRVSAAGGRVSTGLRGDGRFLVQATLPVRP